jgi:hypothetical protein
VEADVPERHGRIEKELEMKIPKDQFMCLLCREVVPEKEAEEYVSAVEWGSFSGRDIKGRCCRKCKKTKIDKNGYVIGRAYA